MVPVVIAIVQVPVTSCWTLCGKLPHRKVRQLVSLHVTLDQIVVSKCSQPRPSVFKMAIHEACRQDLMLKRAKTANASLVRQLRPMKDNAHWPYSLPMLKEVTHIGMGRTMIQQLTPIIIVLVRTIMRCINAVPPPRVGV